MDVFESVDESRQVLFVRYVGVMTDDEFLAHYKRSVEWMAVHGYVLSITDLSEATAVKLGTAAVREAAVLQSVVPLHPQRKAVAFAPQDANYGMARMFEIMANQSGETVQVVRTMSEAYELIGVESLELRPILDW